MLIVQPAVAQTDNGWVLQKDKDGVKVYNKVTAGSSFKSIRAVTTFQQPLPIVVEMISNADTHHQWITRCSESAVLRLFDRSHFVFYEYYNLPFPASNRDIVIEATINYDTLKGEVSITSKNVDNYRDKRDGTVRIPAFQGLWFLRQQQDGIIEGEYTATLDPGGTIPAWFVNMFSASGPYESIVKLRSMLQQNGKQPHSQD